MLLNQSKQKTIEENRVKNYNLELLNLPTDRHFLELSETCLYMVHLGLGPFFKVEKIVRT